MKISKTILILTSLFSVTYASPTAPSGEELAQTKCAKCHMMEVPKPEQIADLKAPAINAVLFHVKLAHPKKEGQKEFIMDYVMNPDIAKSVCESNKVQKFGVMPSQKANVSKEELAKITAYLMESYPKDEFVAMIKEIQTNGKLNALKSSPFLLNQDEFPHLTKMLIQNWDKGTLGLTKEQKEKLLVVRKETLAGVKKIKKALKPLQDEVLDLMYEEEELSKLQPKIEAIAKLKAEGSMIHLKCIKETLAILTDEQQELLLPFWDN